MKRRSTTSKNSIIQKKHGIFHHLVTLKPEICQGEEEEGAPLDSAPRDTSTANSVDYPLTAEGGLNKFHAPFKHERNKEAIDNTNKIMGMEIRMRKETMLSRLLNWNASIITTIS